ncbi:MAG: leucine-rich repeat domain-containing protein [Candidatus Kapaibacterium sp.]
MKKILFLLLFILVISSCKDDEGDIVSPSNEYTPKIITENYGTAKLVGFVKDKSGSPLAGVTVFFGEEKTLTGSDGGYQLNTLSAGSNKRIWFQKSGFASTQKLADIKEDLPNRIDASLFPIDKTEKMNIDGGKIEGKYFSVEIKPGGFVFSDGRPVEEDVFAEVTAFLTSEDEFLDAFPGEFRGTRENGTETAIESFGFIDVVLKVASGEPVQLADGVTAIIKVKAPQNSPATIPMWHYNEDKGKWIEEGVGSLVDGFYIAEVSHFTKWNWDRPYNETSKIIGRVVDNAGNPIEGASVVQKGITYRFQNSAKTNENGTFELLTPESNESEIEAFFDIYGSTIISYTTSPNKGQVDDLGDIIINVSIGNVIEPYISETLFYITIGQTEKIKGKYFGEEKRQGYKLLLNGNEVETTTWKNDLIEFVVPNGIPEEGTIQINRDGVLSRIVNYKEGDWTCEIGGKLYDNNDLPKDSSKYYLNLYYLSLGKIPNCIGNLQNLEILDLYRNQLTSLPESIGNLKNLEYLDIDYNQLTSLPESIGNLQSLEYLILHYNRFSSFPEVISTLQKLEYLSLGNNQLTSLPKSIGNLQNLKTLSLSHNQLTSLPESIKNLKENLIELGLEGNSLSNIEKAKVEGWLPNTNIKW